jgi:hypothetical protein
MFLLIADVSFDRQPIRSAYTEGSVAYLPSEGLPCSVIQLEEFAFKTEIALASASTGGNRSNTCT